jgi:Acyclic terpene utilisation family protein AtuA
VTGADTIRVANSSGYLGDRHDAARELVEAEPLDFLTGDYLAELTMLILGKARDRDPERGYARPFLTQMETVLGLCLDRGVRIVANAGGLNPAGLAARLEELATRLGLSAKIAYLSGDDVLERLPEWVERGVPLTHLDTGRSFAELGESVATANAYLGAAGIAAALGRGADVVICPRVTDAALVVGPAIASFGWSPRDWDELAGAVVAGHILECGAQATGGNFSFFRELGDLGRPGFPIAELAADGSSVITKPRGSGGAVTVDTVTAQLLYEIGPRRYPTPDVVARFDTIELEGAGVDRVRVAGVRGEPAPSEVKLAINYRGGYRNEMTMVLTGLDLEQKADAALASLRTLWEGEEFEHLDTDLLRCDRPDPTRNEEACAFLRVTAKDRDRERVGRGFSDAFVQAALSSYPGFFLTTPPTPAQEFGVYWPTLVPADLVTARVTHWDGSVEELPAAASAGSAPPGPDEDADGEAPDAVAPAADGEVVEVPLGRLFGTRSGDKGGNANLGVWARDERQYAWLHAFLTAERLAELLPDLAPYPIERHPLPNLRGLNFVIRGLLGEGVASSTRLDRQAKGLGEYLGCRPIPVPASFWKEEE